MSPKWKVSFFFLFKLFTKSSWKSERQLPFPGSQIHENHHRTTKTIRERKGKENNAQRLAFWFYPQVSPELLLESKAKQIGKTQTLKIKVGLGVGVCLTRAFGLQRQLCAVRLWCSQQSDQGLLSFSHAKSPSGNPTSPFTSKGQLYPRCQYQN